MAKFGNEATTSGGNNTTNTANELRKIIAKKKDDERGIKERSFQHQTICNHKPTGGLQMGLDLLANNGGTRGNPLYSDEYTVKCMGPDGCGDIFDMEVYTEDQLNTMMYKLYSAAQQIKVMDGASVELDAQSKDDLINVIAMFPSLSWMIRTYVTVMEKQAGVNKHKKMRSNSGGKGGFGMPSGFDGRRY